MKRVLIVHPDLTVIGGAEKVALHIISYLLEQNWQVTILTLNPVNFDKISELTEFSFSKDNIIELTAYCPAKIKKLSSLSLIKLAFLHRAAQKVSSQFDLCISTYNELNFGKPGIQYIHHPYWPERRLLHKKHTIWNRNILDKHPFYEKVYRFFAQTIARNKKGFSQNITLVNSIFIQQIVKSIYDINGTVLYPGFLNDKDFRVSVFNDSQTYQLVTISRLTPDKNILELIHSFNILFRKEPNARLIIAGYPGNPEYLKKISKLISDYKIPIEIKTGISREEVLSLLETSQFYISTKKYEHFGISVLEAAARGCIPLIHRSGGTVEIVPEKELQFNHFDEMPDKIIYLRNNPSELHRIKDDLYRHIQKFHIDYFVKGLEKEINSFLKKENISPIN